LINVLRSLGLNPNKNTNKPDLIKQVKELNLKKVVKDKNNIA